MQFEPLDQVAQEEAYKKFEKFCFQNFVFENETEEYKFFRHRVAGKFPLDYGFSIFFGQNTFGISLDGFDYAPRSKSMVMVLKFATCSRVVGLGRTAAILASNARNKVALFHTGRTFTGDGRGSPRLGKTQRFFGKDYFFISYLDDINFLTNLVIFHRSRSEHAPSIKTATIVERDAVDLGSSRGGTRSSVIFKARHHPVAIALKKKLEDHGWKTGRVKSVRPDLVMQKDNRKILIEIKPSGASHDLMMGLAQLLVYNRLVRAGESFLVARRPNKSALAEAICSALNDEKMHLITFEEKRRQFHFYGLQPILR